MGLGKKLAIGFGIATGVVVGAPIAAAALYLTFNHSVLYKCDVNPDIANDHASAMVVRWNLPALIGERGGKYAMAILNQHGDITYSNDDDNRKALEEQAKTFCQTGKLNPLSPR